MTLKEILKDVLVKLGYGNSPDLDDQNLSAAETDLINKLIAAANLTYQEICTDYLPLTAVTNVDFIEGDTLLANISDALLYVISVKKDGVPKRFRLFSSHLETTFSGTGEVEYSYVPKPFTAITDTLEQTRLPKWLFAEGIAAEFCYAENLTEMAVAFQRKFKEGISAMRNKGGSKYLRERRWY